MAVTIYTTQNGTRYIKVYREFNKVVKQENLRVPKDCTPSELETLLLKAKAIDLGLFPHPKMDFLEWYWGSGKPRCISLDRSNLRLSISVTLVAGRKLKVAKRLAVGIERQGVKEAIKKISDAFFQVHGDELDHVDREEFDLKLTTWLTTHYGIGGSKCSNKNPNSLSTSKP